MLKFYPQPEPEIQTHAREIVTSDKKYVDMTKPATSGHLLLDTREIVDAVLLIAVHGEVTCMPSPKHAQPHQHESSPEPERSGPAKIYRMSMSSIGDLASMDDPYVNHLVLYIHSFLENIKEANKINSFCALSIVCATLAIFYNIPFSSSNIFQISDMTTSSFDKVYGRYNDKGKCNDFNIVLHYKSHDNSHQRNTVYPGKDEIQLSELIRKCYNVTNLYIIDLSCNGLNCNKTNLDIHRRSDVHEQHKQCGFQIVSHRNPFFGLFNNMSTPSSYFGFFNSTSTPSSYDTSSFTPFFEHDKGYLTGIDKFYDRSSIEHKLGVINLKVDEITKTRFNILNKLENLDKLHLKVTRIRTSIETNEFEQKDDMMRKANETKIHIISAIIKCCNGDLFHDFQLKVTDLTVQYPEFIEQGQGDHEYIKKVHTDLLNFLTDFEDIVNLRHTCIDAITESNKEEQQNNYERLLISIFELKRKAILNQNKLVLHAKAQKIRSDAAIPTSRSSGRIPPVIPISKQPSRSQSARPQSKIQPREGGKKLENTLLKLSRYIKERQVAFHPTLRIRKAALDEINGNIVEYALHKVVKGRLSSTSTTKIIRSKMRQLLVENVMESIQKKYDKLLIKTEKTEEILLNKEEQYVHKKINSHLRKMKMELLEKDRRKSMVLLTVMVVKLVDVACKRAGSDLKKQNRNKKKTISKTIEISNVENIKSEIMSVKRQKKNSI